MTASLELRGVYVPLVTPFDAAGAVAYDALERLAHEVIDAGAAGLVALGTTGEVATLDGDERQGVISRCAAVTRERGVQFIVGAGTNNTKATVGAVEALTAVDGCDAALVVVPYYVRPSEAGIVAHFQAVAGASPVPIVIYNIPYRTGRVLGPGGMLELARTPNVAGVKQAVGGVDSDTLEILASAPDGFSVLAGDDAFIYPTVLMGGSGTIAAASHVCTSRFVSMVECGLAAKVEEGRAHAAALLPVATAMFGEPNPMVVKGVLHRQGRIPTPDLRLPMVAASDAAIDAALAAIAAAGD